VVRFALRHDHEDRLRFAPLGGGLARGILSRHGCDSSQVETVVLVKHPGAAEECVLVRSEAALGLLAELGQPWSFIARLLGLVPRWLRDRAYQGVARRRYAMFGRYEACPMPSAEERKKFLE
jgi:predicted DCC family thiol-disulfide oxidoreductase YuxK